MRVTEDPDTPIQVNDALLKLMYGKRLSASDGAGQPVDKKTKRRRVEGQIRRMLEWRHWHMRQKSIPCGGQRYLFTKEDRQEVMRAIQTAYSSTPEQLAKQAADKALAEEKKVPKRNEWLSQRQRSRFQLDMTRWHGGKNVSLAILYTGVHDEDFVATIRQLTGRSDGAPQPVADDDGRRKLKHAKVSASGRLRWGRHLARQIGRGKVKYTDLCGDDRELFENFLDGLLRTQANDATMAFGHGKIHNADGTFHMIGGNPPDAVSQVMAGD